MTSAFHERAIETIRRIPSGRVATYGQIATMAGNPRGARRVVRVLNSSSEKHSLPWHRVVNRQGTISLQRGGGYELQRAKLADEGIEFDKEDCIDLERFLWQPSA